MQVSKVMKVLSTVTLFSVQCVATTVIASVIPSGIYVIADSVEMNPETGQSRQVCKVENINGTFLTQWGVRRSGAFDPNPIVRRILSSGVTTQAKLDQIYDQVGQHYSDYLVAFAKSNPNRLKVGIERIGFLFVWLEKGIPTAGTIELKLERLLPDSAGLSRSSRWFHPIEGGMACYAGGNHAAIQRRLQNGGCAATDMVGRLKSLMDEQSKSDRGTGPPYSVFLIRKDGVQWLDKGTCR